MTEYEYNKQQLPGLDQFERAKNDFLRDIYKKARRWRLSDRQVSAAKKAWEGYQASGGKSPWDQNLDAFPGLEDFKNGNINLNLGTMGTRDLVTDLVEKAKRFNLSDGQIGLLKKIHSQFQAVSDIDIEKIKRVISLLKRCSPRSDFLFDVGEVVQREGQILQSDYEKIEERAHKFKKCIFKKVFQ